MSRISRNRLRAHRPEYTPFSPSDSRIRLQCCVRCALVFFTFLCTLFTGLGLGIPLVRVTNLKKPEKGATIGLWTYRAAGDSPKKYWKSKSTPNASRVCFVVALVLSAISFFLGVAYVVLHIEYRRQRRRDDQQRERIVAAYDRWYRLDQWQDQNGGPGGYYPPSSSNTSDPRRPSSSSDRAGKKARSRDSGSSEDGPQDADSARDVLQGMVRGKTSLYFADREYKRRLHDRNVGIALFSMLAATAAALLIAIACYASWMPKIQEKANRNSSSAAWAAGFILPVFALILILIMGTALAMPFLSGLRLCGKAKVPLDHSLCFLTSSSRGGGHNAGQHDSESRSTSDDASTLGDGDAARRRGQSGRETNAVYGVPMVAPVMDVAPPMTFAQAPQQPPPTATAYETTPNLYHCPAGDYAAAAGGMVGRGYAGQANSGDVVYQSGACRPINSNTDYGNAATTTTGGAATVSCAPFLGLPPPAYPTALNQRTSNAAPAAPACASPSPPRLAAGGHCTTPAACYSPASPSCGMDSPQEERSGPLQQQQQAMAMGWGGRCQAAPLPPPLPSVSSPPQQQQQSHAARATCSAAPLPPPAPVSSPTADTGSEAGGDAYGMAFFRGGF